MASNCQISICRISPSVLLMHMDKPPQRLQVPNTSERTRSFPFVPVCFSVTVLQKEGFVPLLFAERTLPCAGFSDARRRARSPRPGEGSVFSSEERGRGLSKTQRPSSSLCSHLHPEPVCRGAGNASCMPSV